MATYVDKQKCLQHRLMIDDDPQSDYLVAENGLPVWPVRCIEDRQALENLAELFSCDIEVVRARKGTTNAIAEVVAALGPGLEQVARLYAHLTRRHFRRTNKLPDLCKPTPPEVVIAKPASLTAGAMNLLYSNRSVAPGLICADNAEFLRRQVLLRSAAASMPPGDTERLSKGIFPTLPISHIAGNGFDILGALATADEIRAALKTGSPILLIGTHADGVDASLGSSLVLCPFDQIPDRTYKKHDPSCIVSGFCHRRNLPIRAALESGALVSPDEIPARVLIFDVCFGVLLADSPIDPAWGLAPRLFNSSSLGAVLTTWELIFLNPAELDPLRIDLQMGMTVGRALARFNRVSLTHGRRNRLCLLGDPSVRAVPQKPVVKTRRNTEHKVNRCKKTLSKKILAELREIAFARAYLGNAISVLAKSTEQASSLSTKLQKNLDSAQTALERIEKYELAAWKGQIVEGGRDSAGPAMRQALLDYSFKRGKIIHDWFPLAYFDKIRWKPCTCPACGRKQASKAEVELRVPGVSNRRIVTCPTCGLVEDLMSHSRLRFSINIARRQVRLYGNLPKQRWSGAIQLRSNIEQNCRMWSWPARSDGYPTNIFRIPEPWPAGPLCISVLIASCGTIESLSKQIHTGHAKMQMISLT